jgi:drug/metabolite transporter, DME family
MTAIMSRSPDHDRKKRMAWRGGLLVLVAASLWGTAGVAARWIHEAGTLSSTEIGFWRMGLAAPLLLIAAALMGGRPRLGANRPLLLIILMGLALAGFQVGYFTAIAAIGVALATLLAICTIPVLTAFLAWPIYGEKPGLTIICALGLACAGMVLIVGGADLPRMPGSGGLRLGLPMALTAGLCFALLTLAGRSLPPAQHPLWTAGLTLSIAALALAPVVLLQAADLPANEGLTWPALLWIALLPTAVAYVLFYSGVGKVASGTAGLLILAEPLTANILAWLVHDERLGSLGWLGAALLLVAMALGAKRPD